VHDFLSQFQILLSRQDFVIVAISCLDQKSAAAAEGGRLRFVVFFF
jgi:hypothetical protein